MELFNGKWIERVPVQEQQDVVQFAGKSVLDQLAVGDPEALEGLHLASDLI